MKIEKKCRGIKTICITMYEVSSIGVSQLVSNDLSDKTKSELNTFKV